MDRQKIEVLLIEDSPAEADFITEMLQQAPRLECSIRHDVYLKDALTRLEHQKFDVILVDLGLPDSQGLETALTVRRQALQTPVVVLTVLDDEDVALKSLEMDIQDYLIKGEINSALLSRSIRYAMQRKRADIAQKAAEEALQKSETKFAKIFHSSPALIVVSTAREGTVIDVNETALKILKYEREEMIGRTTEEIGIWKDIADRSRVVQMLKEHGSVRNVEIRWKGKTGMELVGLYSGELVELTGELCIVGAVRDITERKKAEDDVIRAREEWELTFNTVPDLIAILDDRHRIVRVNKAMAQRLGQHPETLAGRTCYEVIHHDGRPSDFCPHSRTLADRRENHVEVHEPLLGGDFLVSTTPLIRHDGTMQGAVHVARDITEQKRTTAELERLLGEVQRSNQDLQQFAYVASHDLKEPLRMVSSYMQLLEKKYAQQLDDKARSYIRYAADGATRMQALIEGLLKYSRITVEKDLLAIDVNISCSAAIANLKQTLKEEGGKVTVDTLPIIPGDETQMIQLFQNLIGNGLKYRKPGVPPEVRVSARREGEEWVFSVSDNGIGIAAEDFEKVFQIFQRLHTREEYPGTGIGLASCKKIVERHGGRIWVESRPGEGSTFRFSLPAKR